MVMTRLVGALPWRSSAAFGRPFVPQYVGLVAPSSVPRVGPLRCVRRVTVVERPPWPGGPKPSAKLPHGLRASTP